TLDLKITPVTQENDGHVKFDPEHPFSIAYGDGSGNYSGTTPSYDTNDSPSLTVNSTEADGTEDSDITTTDFATTSNGELSYLVSNIENGSLTSAEGFFKLPNGDMVTTNKDLVDDITPKEDFNGKLDIDVTVIATNTSNGAEATANHTVVVDVAPDADSSTVNADNGSETDDGEAINLNLRISSGDSDGSEAVSGDITITAKDGGTFSNGSETITVDASELNSVTFSPPAYTHGKFDFDISYTMKDTDAHGADDSATTDVNTTFSINLSSHVDSLSVEITPDSTTVLEGQELPLGLDLTQADSDGSEIASVVITGLPEGAVLSAGTIRTLEDGTKEFVLKASEIDDAKVIADPHFSGEFTITAKAYSYDIKSSEISESDVVTKEFSITPVASGIEVDADGFRGDEDTAISIKLDLTLQDTDGSETLNVTLSGYEAGSTFTIDNGNTTCTNESETEGEYLITGLTPEQAESLAIIPPANYHGTMENITVSVQTVDGDSVLEEGVTDTFSIVVDSVVDREVFEYSAENYNISYDEDSDIIKVDETEIDYVEELQFGNDSFNVIKGTSGDDTIEGTSEADIIFAGAGEDTIKDSDEADVVYGGSGEDALLVEGELELDFTKVSSVETIDMSGNDSSDSITMVNIDDMLDTDNDTIEIRGDDGDSIAKGEDEPSTEVTPKDDGTKEISVPDGSLKAIVDEGINTSGFDDDTNAVS
ncbi:MAG: hypothetical protein ACLFOC_08485, partial [Campylobacterales bacterium]